mmetsp:Transcript_14410/g.20624  ORF Transcript_14410/g.20624 Transcript_14410/m.20624 type:complete len:110 (+) Transcript_14410:667-996(+)
MGFLVALISRRANGCEGQRNPTNDLKLPEDSTFINISDGNLVVASSLVGTKITNGPGQKFDTSLLSTIFPSENLVISICCCNRGELGSTFVLVGEEEGVGLAGWGLTKA